MLGGRRKLPVLAEISGPVPDRTRVFSLHRDDFARLGKLQERLAGRRSLLVTGAAEASGTVATAVAGAACAAGRRVVLVDCDLESPRLAADLGMAEAPGVHEYLRWEADAQEILQPITLAGSASAPATMPLAFIGAGRPAPSADVLLSLQSFRHMVEKLRHAYDLVVLAGPTLGPGDGTLAALAGEADAVLAALTPELASGRAGRAARAAIRPLATEALGAVVVAGDDARAEETQRS